MASDSLDEADKLLDAIEETFPPGQGARRIVMPRSELSLLREAVRAGKEARDVLIEEYVATNARVALAAKLAAAKFAKEPSGD